MREMISTMTHHGRLATRQPWILDKGQARKTQSQGLCLRNNDWQASMFKILSNIKARLKSSQAHVRRARRMLPGRK